MRITRLVSAALVVLIGSACGSANSAPSDPGLLKLAQKAQAYLRSGAYSFTETGARHGSATGLSGIPPVYSILANASHTWTASGAVSSDHHLEATADFSAFGSIEVVESGCSGYATADAQHWASSESDRLLARLLAPSIDDSVITAGQWTDLGTSRQGGTNERHIRAKLTPLSMAGASPAPNASPPPGLSLNQSFIDVWTRDSDGSVAALKEHIDMVIDVSAGTYPQYPGATGRMEAVLDEDVTLSEKAPDIPTPVATLQSDPATGMDAAFGLFGVEADQCPTSSQST